MDTEKDPKTDPKRTESDFKSEETEEYSFIQEKIKPKDKLKDRIVKGVLHLAVPGIVFGFFACLGFYMLEPWVAERFGNSAEQVTIPDDTVSGDNGNGEEQGEAGTGSEEEPEEEPAVLTADNYQELMSSIYEQARDAEKSVVSISPEKQEDDVLQSGENTPSQESAGVIIADNGQELLILTSSEVCKDAENWQVRFVDETTYTASLKKQDRISGLAVLSVRRSSINNNTWREIQTATLGNSNMIDRGAVVMALGNTFGYAEGLGYGVVSSTQYTKELADGTYHILATDIPASANGTGILFNVDGAVIGMIKPDIWKEQESGSANAYAISDLKNTIELLSNGKSVPYLGIHGIEINDETAEAQEMPTGIYVSQVDADSPAMQAGIQSGDILNVINKKSISSILVYRQALLRLEVEQEVKITGQRRGNEGYEEIDFTVIVGTQE